VVIGERHEWTFGDGHLLLLGDMLGPRGTGDAGAVVDLRLEQEAVRAGGRVHYILGNHEVMAMQGDCRYAIGKYKALARMLHPEDDLRSAYAKLFSAGTPLGAWLRTKHAVERIGGDLFVHGGISPALVAAGLSPAEISQFDTEPHRPQAREHGGRQHFGCVSDGIGRTVVVPAAGGGQ
jgi:hypothetical protein